MLLEVVLMAFMLMSCGRKTVESANSVSLSSRVAACRLSELDTLSLRRDFVLMIDSPVFRTVRHDSGAVAGFTLAGRRAVLAGRSDAAAVRATAFVADDSIMSVVEAGGTTVRRSSGSMRLIYVSAALMVVIIVLLSFRGSGFRR